MIQEIITHGLAGIIGAVIALLWLRKEVIDQRDIVDNKTIRILEIQKGGKDQ